MNKVGCLSAERFETLVTELKQSRKYRGVSETVIRGALYGAATRQNHPDLIIKAAKRKLHQIYGAFSNADNLNRISKILNIITKTDTDQTIKAACSSILRFSASTRERMDYLDELYDTIFASLGTPQSIVDIACGLNPFSRPWMSIPAEVQYIAWDIDESLMGLINRFFGQMGYSGRGEAADVLACPLPPADVAFLFKALPSLEQQEKGASRRILANLPAEVVIVSFPTRSLSGRDKGMRENYRHRLEQLTKGLAVDLQSWEFPAETFYLIKRR